MTLSDHLHDVIALLRYHLSSGITHYPRDEGTERFLQAAGGVRPPLVRPDDGGAHLRQESSPRHPVPDRLSEDPADVDAVLAAIVEEVAVCRACSLSGHRVAARAGQGGRSGVRLMVVGDWLRCGTETALPDSVQFGIEEDRMVARMLQAIHLLPEDVFIANVIKCVVPETHQPAAEHIRTCLSYLHRQIALLRPECICAMGLVAARALVGGTLPLSRLRGRPHPLAVGEGRAVPVIVTYHPSYLLKNLEMKRAAWVDLQEIGRRLNLLS